MYRAADYARKNDLLNKIEAKNFKFNGDCPNCQTNMTVYTSEENESIYMCKHCGYIYLSENIRNIKLYNYKYKRHKGVFEPVCREITSAQISYLEILTERLPFSIDFNSFTKEEAQILIGKLITEPLSESVPILKEHIKT